MGFIDEVEITVKSGNGGPGCISFRRERFLPKGGPDGGDGGKGGDVFIRSSSRTHSLLDSNSRRSFKARNGSPGMGKKRNGKKGKDIEIVVPVGTVIKDTESGQIIADLTHDDQRILVAKGGKGGKGNKRFATSTNRAPAFALKGETGQEKKIGLELKLIADIGLIGFPNVGKSTILSRLSDAYPKIASYPFTTLAPNLGVIVFDFEQDLTIADIPGLVEGASEGKGLGHKFLKHIERTRSLFHIIDLHNPCSGDVLNDFHLIEKELGLFGDSLARKGQLILLNKIDLCAPGGPDIDWACKIFREIGHDCIPVSALTGAGMDKVKTWIKENILPRLN